MSTKITKIQHKRSSEPGKSPQAEDLEMGEFAVNDHDEVLYYKRHDGSIGILAAGKQESFIQNIADLIAREQTKALRMKVFLGMPIL